VVPGSEDGAGPDLDPSVSVEPDLRVNAVSAMDLLRFGFVTMLESSRSAAF
jgi:hypothetical protein